MPLVIHFAPNVNYCVGGRLSGVLLVQSGSPSEYSTYSSTQMIPCEFARVVHREAQGLLAIFVVC